MATVQARVEDLAHDGAGVVKIEGRVYFVDGVLPGELIEFEPRKKRRGKFHGIVHRVIEFSPQRVDPRCQYFGICGGCAQQHFDPDAQLQFKEKVLFDNLERIGKITPEKRLKPVQASIWQYRRKARPGIRYVPKKGGVLLGFRERNSSYITSLRECHTLDARLSALLPGLHELLDQISCRSRLPQLEVAAADNALALVLRHLEPLSASDVSLLKRYASDNDLQFFLQPGGIDSVEALWPESPAALYYRLDEYDLTMRFKPNDFIQVNAEVNRIMISQAVALLDPQPEDSMLDLFCGLGNFTLPIARSGATVLGVEGDAALVERAADNALLNEVTNVTFRAMDLHQESVEALAVGLSVDKLLLDPPRSGAAEVVKHLLPGLTPRVIVYVSCNPSTLARDAEMLSSGYGYRMTHAGAIDMFPHTAHVESMARFEL